MSPTTAIVWKETRETLIYLWIGLFVFLVLPLVQWLEALFQFSKHGPVQTSLFVISCGGILAVFVAVGATCRDLSPKLMDFWQSRPVSTWRWMLIKFIVGLVILQLACATPLLVEFTAAPRDAHSAHVFDVLFLFSAIYSIAFLAGVLLRRTAHAAMFGLAAMVLLWALPSILPELKWLDVRLSLEEQNFIHVAEIQLAIATLGLSLVALLAALLAVGRNWQIEAGRKAMYAALGGAVLILLGSVTMRWQTNLPVLQTLALPPGASTDTLYWKGDSGILHVNHPQPGGGYTSFAQTLRLIDGRLELGPTHEDYVTRYMEMATPESQPNLCYFVTGPPIQSGEAKRLTASDEAGDCTLQLVFRDTGEQRTIATLWPAVQAAAQPVALTYHNQLFVFDEKRLATFDLTDPQNPRETARGDFDFSWNSFRLNGEQPTQTVALLQLPIAGISPRERLDLSFKPVYSRLALEGDLLCLQGEDSHAISAYRITKLTDTVAVFERIAQHKASAAEMIFGVPSTWNMRLCNGLLYTSNWNYGRVPVNPSVSVYDPRDNLKMIGHFAAPGAGVVEPLPDGRAIVAGSSVFLVGPPPKHATR